MESITSAQVRQPVQRLARELRADLPPATFRRTPSRLLWLPVHLGVVAATALWIVRSEPPWYLATLAAVAAGHSWGCLGFLAHETLHHALVRSRRLEMLVGSVGFLPYCLSPRLWRVWHNQAHHGNTGKPIADPDGYGTLGFWKKSAVVRALERIAPGSGYARSAIFPFVWFSIHSFLVLVFHGPRNGYFARVSRRAVYADSAAMLAVWLVVLGLVGPRAFVFVYVLPTLVANALVMSYIATNHFLNPLTEVNDPLANSLSVTSPRWVEWLHLQFGYHVEHHVFPTMSGRHAPAVRDALIARYGAHYLTMPHMRALRLLYTRPKVHGTHDTLVDPRTLVTFNALMPGDLSMARVRVE